MVRLGTGAAAAEFFSPLLSPLQKLVASIVAGLPEASGFALAGGAALVVRGDVDRITRDLDFFAMSADEVRCLLPALERALDDAGLQLERRRISSGFVRLAVSDGVETTEVDLAADFRLRPAESGPLGPILAGEELAADKTLALFGRAEARDFIDVFFLSQRYGLKQMCELAAEKDPGFRLDVFVEMLGTIGRLPRDEFEVDDSVFDELLSTVAEWRERLCRP